MYNIHIYVWVWRKNGNKKSKINKGVFFVMKNLKTNILRHEDLIIFYYLLLELSTVKSSCKLRATGWSCVYIIFLPRSGGHSHSPGTALQWATASAAADDIILQPRIITPITKPWAACPVYRPVRSRLCVFPPSVSTCFTALDQHRQPHLYR